MSSTLKPIKLYGAHGPNPPKIAILLEELSLPYETIDIPLSDVKNPEYVAINPNGRIPSITDPNTGITLWETGAIILYLIERYDNEHKLSFPEGTPEAAHARQWLFFQATGQAPYYGQAAWFTRYHPEKIPSAIERYINEAGRVSGVLEGWLAGTEKQHGAESAWLVGGRISYADLAFVTWQSLAHAGFSAAGFKPEEYPHVKAWLGKMTSRPKTRQVLQNAGLPIPDAA